MQPKMMTENMFHSLTFRKPFVEIQDRMVRKSNELKHKITEREERIAKLREEYSITETMLVDLFRQARNAERNRESVVNYSTTRRNAGGMEETVIGAGVVNALLTESDFIEAARKDIDRLGLLSRNLGPRRITEGTMAGQLVDDHELTLAELLFLGY